MTEPEAAPSLSDDVAGMAEKLAPEGAPLRQVPRRPYVKTLEERQAEADAARLAGEEEARKQAAAIIAEKDAREERAARARLLEALVMRVFSKRGTFSIGEADIAQYDIAEAALLAIEAVNAEAGAA